MTSLESRPKLLQRQTVKKKKKKNVGFHHHTPIPTHYLREMLGFVLIENISVHHGFGTFDCFTFYIQSLLLRRICAQAAQAPAVR